MNLSRIKIQKKNHVMDKVPWRISLIAAFITILLPACGKKVQPEEPCHFVQNSQLQRVSWGYNAPAKFLVHKSVPVEAYAAIKDAADVWNKGFGRDLIEIGGFGYAGDLAPKNDGVSVIYWMPTWDKSRPDEQARTTIHWVGNQLINADIMLNNFHFDFHLKSEGPIVGVDLRSLLIHEMGHALGLAHNSSTGSSMVVSLKSGVERREIDKVDLDALRCEY